MTDTTPLRGKRVVILVEHEYDHVDLDAARIALAWPAPPCMSSGPIAGHELSQPRRPAGGGRVRRQRRRAADVDAVVIPGGHAPDKMRMRHAMVDLVRDAIEAGKPVAAIDHGPSVLINANALSGRMLTCWPSIAIDVKNAGGRYVDQPVVEDGNLITSRKSDDLPFFTEAIIRQLLAKRVRLTAAAARRRRSSRRRTAESPPTCRSTAGTPRPRRSSRARSTAQVGGVPREEREGDAPQHGRHDRAGPARREAHLARSARNRRPAPRRRSAGARPSQCPRPAGDRPTRHAARSDENQRASTTRTALTMAIATTNIAPAETIIRNENSRWRMKLRRFSTPHAWLTAEVMALKTPSDASQRQAAAHADARRGRCGSVELAGDEVELAGEIAEHERHHAVARGRSSVKLPSTENSSRKNGKNDSSA